MQSWTFLSPYKDRKITLKNKYQVFVLLLDIANMIFQAIIKRTQSPSACERRGA